MSYPQYGVYLIPPPELLYPLSVAQSVLAKEFGSRTASKFMVHCTLKGFFKLVPDASPDDLVPALDELFARTPPFTAQLYPSWVSKGGKRGESVILWMDNNEPVMQLHNAVWEIVAPYVAPDCLFTPVEPAGTRFVPHITLIQSDLPAEAGMLAQAEELCGYIYDSLPAHSFTAQDMQLIEFYSEEWAGEWWETLRYRQLKGWRLQGAAQY